MSLIRLCALGVICFGGVAHAQTVAGTSQTPFDAGQEAVANTGIGSDTAAAASTPADTSQRLVSAWRSFNDATFSFHGITLYGGLDMGVGYQSHGTPTNGAYGPGDEYLISKNSNEGRFGAAPNAMSYSDIGLRGSEPIVPGLSAIFNMQTTFNPDFFMLSDGLRSLEENNGVPLNEQTSNGDLSRAGQPLNSFYYAGVSSPIYGALTFGRQNTFTLDEVVAYDPMSGSNAFSVIGYSGATGGGGDTEDARLDNAVKYRVSYGPVHFGTLYQIGSLGGANWPHSAYQFDLGTKVGGFSVDGVFSKIHGAVAASSLTAAQVQVEPVNSLAATISDNTSVMLMAKYTIGAMTYLGGYAHIGYSNPHNAVDAPFTGLSGYTMSSVDNTAFPHQKTLQVFWAGGQYAFNRKLDLMGAYYHEFQNSYGISECHTSASPMCSGSLDAVSLVADYHFTKRLDAYAGAMYSTVADGLASGYLNRNSIDPTIGTRIQF